MKLAPHVTLAGLRRTMRPALIAADEIWERNGQELTVTSHCDGVHGAHSVHYYGFALDFSTQGFDEDTRRITFLDLAQRLEPDYICKQRPNHVHVEYRFWEYSR